MYSDRTKIFVECDSLQELAMFCANEELKGRTIQSVSRLMSDLKRPKVPVKTLQSYEDAMKKLKLSVKNNGIT